MTDKKAKPLVNQWQDETIRLLEKIRGKSEVQVRKLYSAAQVEI